MAFHFSDRHIAEYHSRGYTVFEQILPPSLLADLRRVSDQARQLARRERGVQTQRLQPVGAHDIDQQSFADYTELPELNDAIVRLLSPAHHHGGTEFMGILFEPAETPYCTQWHRDWRDNASGLPLQMWDEFFADLRYFNQVNCALYDDSSTWVVPGSHLRRDLPGEAARFPERPIAKPELDGLSYEQCERVCLEYCRSMPGAVQLHLNAGDFALYRNTLWHIGNYVPYRKRATLHDSVDTAEFAAWRQRAQKIMQQRRAAGIEMENPNATG
jgi:ectoine hydroxylase-related dioxygenase (phytanoyl-CoA dioxygenase family)